MAHGRSEVARFAQVPKRFDECHDGTQGRGETLPRRAMRRQLSSRVCWAMVRLRTAGSADYRGKAADARMCDVPEALHVEHLVISRSIYIQDRKTLISVFYCKACQFFYDSERLGKADIEEWSGLKLSKRRKTVHTFENHGSIEELKLIIWCVALFCSWYGGLDCYTHVCHRTADISPQCCKSICFHCNFLLLQVALPLRM